MRNPFAAGPSYSDIDDQSTIPESMEEIASREAEQNEVYQKQLKTLQLEEISMNSILLELRSQSRKLTLEKSRLLDLCKEKQEEEQTSQNQDQPR